MAQHTLASCKQCNILNFFLEVTSILSIKTFVFTQSFNYLYLRFLFVCLFVCGFSSYSRIFHSYGDVTIAGEWLQIYTYARHA